MKPSPHSKILKRYNLVLMRPGFENLLKNELDARFGLASEVLCRAGVGVVETFPLPKLVDTIFARQYMPMALRHAGETDELALKFLTTRVDVMINRGNRQEGQWTLHAFAIDDDAGLARARKLSKALMEHIRKNHPPFFKRHLSKDEFTKSSLSSRDFVLQIYCPARDDLWFSVARVAEGISVHEAGFRPMKALKGAPSRSASKLEEALSFMGRHPSLGETAVDLGAAPGGWSMVLARHGANVEAIDHAELKLDPKQRLKGTITHLKANGLKYLPNEPVDWLVCDMVMGASDTVKILRKWIAADAMRQFVVNLKLPKQNAWQALVHALQLIENTNNFEINARQLLHDRSEITLVGIKKS